SELTNRRAPERVLIAEQSHPYKAAPTTAILSVCVGPLLVLWGLVLLLNALTPLGQLLFYLPPSRWWSALQMVHCEHYITIYQLWAAAIVLLACGYWLTRIGIDWVWFHVLRPTSD